MEYALQNGRFTAVATTRGGELVSFREGQTEYLWQGDPAYWAGRNPILFPVVGALKDGVVQSPNGPCRMDRHGFARNSQFTLAEQREHRVTLELTESAETLAQYPYPFRLRVTHELTDAGFETSYAVKNTGPSPMPFCVGGHTAFNCPMHPGEAFEDYRLVFDQREYAHSIAVHPGGLLGGFREEEYLFHTDTIPLRHDIFDEADTLVFNELLSAGVSLVHGDTGRGLRVDFREFPMLGIWTMPGKNAPYICIEPWQGCGARLDETGRFEDKPHAVILAPGQEKFLSFSVDLL